MIEFMITTQKSVERVIRELANEQLKHLRRGRVERTFTFELANKLRPIFAATKNITVDPFYNKHGDAAKYLDEKIIELDIAVHQQGIDKNNLVAIELETNNRPTHDDIWKIESLTQPLGGYGYKFGLFLVVGVSERAGEIIEMSWYQNGKLL